MNKILESGMQDISWENLFRTDYVLLQDSHSLTSYELTPFGTVRKTRNLLFDAGTSRFDSSLFWFTCGYSQVILLLSIKIHFDVSYISLISVLPL